MQRLAFTLPDFCRVSWASEAAKSRWNPVFERCRTLWQRLEIETVRLGVRRVGLVTFQKSGLAEWESRLSQERLQLRALYSFDSKGYVSDLNRSNDGGALTACLVGRVQEMAEASEAYSTHQTYLLGQMLGYPSCCIEFFDRVWNIEHYIDTTWPMTIGSRADDPLGEFEANTQIDLQHNLMLRWLGLRPVFHLPCSLDCEKTLAIANTIRNVAVEIGEKSDIDALYEVLGWPVQWSALHGIAEIETPVCRISTRTDATAKKYVIRSRGGATSIADAPNGTRFPFTKMPTARKRDDLIQIPQAPKHSTGFRSEAWYHADNGFRSNIDMDRALLPLVKASSNFEARSVLHICCKNGALLLKLAEFNSTTELFGIDPDDSKIQRARQLLPNYAANLWTGNLFEPRCLQRIKNVDVCFIMIGRLLEIPFERAVDVLAILERCCQTVLVYAFDDWRVQGSLHLLSEKLGLRLAPPLDGGESVAQVNRWPTKMRD